MLAVGRPQDPTETTRLVTCLIWGVVGQASSVGGVTFLGSCGNRGEVDFLQPHSVLCCFRTSGLHSYWLLVASRLNFPTSYHSLDVCCISSLARPLPGTGTRTILHGSKVTISSLYVARTQKSSGTTTRVCTKMAVLPVVDRTLIFQRHLSMPE